MYFYKDTKYYDPDTKEVRILSKFPPLPKKDFPDTQDNFLNVNGNLYVARGTDSSTRKLKHPQFLRLDEIHNKWISLAPMLTRGKCKVFLHTGGKIYAFYPFCVRINGTNCKEWEGEVYDISRNIWELLPSRSQPTLRNIGDYSYTAYKDKILLYSATPSTAPDDGRSFSSVDHILQVFDPILNEWSVPLTVSHPMVAGLVVNAGKCYRIFYSLCTCSVEGCQWHDKSTIVNEIVFNDENGTVSIGDRQDQTLLPLEFQEMHFFCLDGEVFIDCETKCESIFKTGITTNNRELQTHLKELHALLEYENPEETRAPGITTFTFDKLKWL